MKASKYIKKRGMQVIIAECDNNLRNIRNHLLRETDITSDKVYRVLADFKNYLKEPVKPIWKKLIDEITRKIMSFFHDKGTKENKNGNTI